MSEGLDTVVAAETPEGILLELRPAGLTARFYAFGVDWTIRLMVLHAVAMVTGLMGGIGIAIWIILLFACEWLYPIVFELASSGATPGKRIFNLKVVMDNGLPVTPAASITATCCARLIFCHSLSASRSRACCCVTTINGSAIWPRPPSWCTAQAGHSRGHCGGVTADAGHRAGAAHAGGADLPGAASAAIDH